MGRMNRPLAYSNSAANDVGRVSVVCKKMKFSGMDMNAFAPCCAAIAAYSLVARNARAASMFSAVRIDE